MTATRTCRLLYYGAGTTGKRDNLRLINQSLPPENRLSLASADPERQIAFRMRTDRDGDWQVLVQTIDAGHEQLPAAGRGSRINFDGVVFVVSSRAPHLDQALASLEGLKSYLEAWGLDLMTLPVVIQYNNREANDALPLERLESLINPWGLLSYPASTTRGEGVRETLKSILGLSINHVKERIIVDPVPSPETTFPEQEFSVESGPPLPGMEELIESVEPVLSEAGPSPAPLVIPVQVPRHLVQGQGPLRVLLEIHLTD